MTAARGGSGCALRRAPARRVCRLIAAACALASFVFASGCGEATDPTSVGSSSPTSGTPYAGSAVILQTKEATPFTTSNERLELPHRDYRYPGSLRAEDFTDRVVVLLENTPKHQRLWLMSAASGRRRLLFPRAVTDSPGFWIGSVRVSDSWLVWEEVGSGDDLAEAVDWRLYGARLDQTALTVGKPQLIASGSNVAAARPLFDVEAGRLAWISTRWSGQKNNAIDSRLVLRELSARRDTVVYRSLGVLETASFSDGRLIVGETTVPGQPQVHFVIFDEVDRAGFVQVERFAAENDHALSHWPGWRRGYLSWAPFASDDAMYPLLFVRDPSSGRTYSAGGHALDPCMVGDYMFYQATRPGSPSAEETHEVRAVRLADMESFVLESGTISDNEWWVGAIGAPDPNRSYVVCLDRALRAERANERYTTVRVYSLAR